MATDDPSALQALLDLFAQARYRDALAAAESLTSRHPDSGMAWKLLGAALKSLGRSSEALEPMQRSVELLPEDAGALNNLAVTLRSLGRSTEARACYEKALRQRCADSALCDGAGFASRVEAAYRQMVDRYESGASGPR